ncbi:hypothetical protein HU200_029688 [Digitaria exilis]|uniref:DUF1618 domain-containing protein n=1 Tax=Digitaria exilis TaxID=1010633 RepID=A0A835BSY5_9POAL|nr:hypothetical protein HU200_029688 [Digitaria exilis]
MRLLGPSQRVPFRFVVERFVDLESPPVDLHQQWATIASPNLTSALYIELNDDALRGIKAEFGHGFDGPLIQIDDNHGGFHVVAFIDSAYDDRFIFLTLLFSLRREGERKYYLVYNTVVASLSMIPYLPLAITQWSHGHGGRSVVDGVCVETRWKHRRRSMADGPDALRLPPALAEGSDVVEFGFIDIPPECPPDERWTKPKLELTNVFSMIRDRTMSCVMVTTRFVCIDRSRPYGGVNVSVELNLVTRVWRKHKSFRAKELWNMWSFKRSDLPEMEPRFPILMLIGIRIS